MRDLVKNRLQLLSQRVKKRRLRLTRQRTIVLEELAKVDTHPRADQLYRMVRQRLPTISFGTVYRNLKTLCQLELVTELKLGQDSSRFDARTDPHHHVACTHCGCVVDVELPVESGLQKKAARQTGFAVSHYQTAFFGTCPRCRGKS